MKVDGIPHSMMISSNSECCFIEWLVARISKERHKWGKMQTAIRISRALNRGSDTDWRFFNTANEYCSVVVLSTRFNWYFFKKIIIIIIMRINQRIDFRI